MQSSHAYLVQGKERPDCLSIIDPHRQDNNISAGTHEIQRIVNCFAKAHETLQHRLHDELIYVRRSGSFLEDILGGNFSAYELQRQSLYNLHTEMLQSSSAVPPPPPAPIPASKVPPPPPPSTANLPQSVDLSVHPARGSAPRSGTASKQNTVNGGSSSTVNGPVGVHFADSSSQVI
jgi:DNA polymerase sigma